jgi:nucleoside 2-deoxyribosyltransferase
MRVYMGGPMFTLAEVEYNLRLAAKLRALGFDIYCPNESEPINDKTRSDITARRIYDYDIAELEASNVLLCQVSEDSGTNWEAGYMDCLSKHVDPNRYYGIVGLATDIRLRTTPDPNKAGVENMSFAPNALVVGGMQSSLGIYTDEGEALARLVKVRAEREGA